MGCVASGQRSFSSDYLIGPKVATGTFSQTRVVTDRKTGEVRAAKLRSAPYEVADCQFETELLSELNYAGRSGCARPKNCNTDPQADDARESESSNRGVQYLLRFYGAYSEKTFFCEIFELCEGGELMYLDPEEEVTEADVARWIRQLLMAVEALHIRSIVHRNVNPSSVLLREKGRQNIRLGGFGLACRVSGHELLKDACGSTAYLAPEILIGNYGRKVDIWAVGVLLYIFLFGRFPFIASDTFRLFKNIIEEEPPWTYIPTRDLPWPCSDHSMSSLSSETILCTAACPPFRSVAPASCGDSTELVSGTDRFSVSLSSQSAHVAGSGGRHREKEGSQDTAKMAKGGIRDRIYPGGMVEESSCSGKLAGVSAVSCYSSGSASPSSQTQGGRKGSSGVHSPVRGSIHQGSCSLVTSPSPIAGGGKPSLATSVGRLSPGSRQPGQDVVAQAKHSRTTEEPSQRGESLVSEVSRGNPTDSPTRSNSCCKSDCKERASSGGLEKTGDSSDLGADSASQVKRTATAGENEDTESDPSPAGRYTLSMSHQTRPPSRGSTEVCQALSATYEGARVRDDAAANGHRLCISLSSGFGRDGTATASKEEGKLQKTCFGAEIVELSSNKIPTVALSDVQEKGDKGAGRKNDGDAEGSGFVGPRSSSEFVGKGSPRRKSWRDGGDDDAYTPAPAAVELCKSLLQKNFLGRPTATEALAHPWLQEEAWANGRKGIILPASLRRRITLCSTEMRLKNPSRLPASMHLHSDSAFNNTSGNPTPAETPRAVSFQMGRPSKPSDHLSLFRRPSRDYSARDSLILTRGDGSIGRVHFRGAERAPTFSRQYYSSRVSSRLSRYTSRHRVHQMPSFPSGPEKSVEENVQLLSNVPEEPVSGIEVRDEESHVHARKGNPTSRQGPRSGSRVSLRFALLKKNSTCKNASSGESEGEGATSEGESGNVFKRGQHDSVTPAQLEGSDAGLPSCEGKKGGRLTEPGVPKAGAPRRSRLEETAYEAYQADVLRVRAT